MKAKTLIEFFDKKEETLREVGDEFELNQTRFDEILSGIPGAVEAVKSVAKKPTTKAKEK